MAEYELIRSERKTFAAEIKQGRLILRVPKRASEKEIKAFIKKHQTWIDAHLARSQEAADVPRLTPDELRKLANEAMRVIPARVTYYAPLVGVTYGRITIRSQRTRWGSCSSKGNLSFNCLLMLAPPEVIDSVVVHELCHRREMNHSDKFYAEVLRVFPQYYECRKWLKENGSRLMNMLP